VGDEENLDLIKRFILTALHHDFYCEGCDEIKAEGEFNIKSESPKYHINGFIDQLAIYEGDKTVHIRDFKSSKAKFSGEKKTFNVQAMMYCLAARHIYPNLKNRKFSFLFLKFGSKPEQEVPEFTNEELDGFEAYLEYLGDHLENFNLQKACSNFAADSNENYWLCGKKRGELNKAGEPAWICPFKYPFKYFAALREDGSVIKTFFEEQEEEAITYGEKEGVKIETKNYGGCPKWKKRLS